MNVLSAAHTLSTCTRRLAARVTVLGLAGSAALASLGCGSATEATSDAAQAASATPAPVVSIPAQPTLDAQGLPEGIEHYKKWSDRIGQGGQPVGDVAFQNLAAMGYKTILSVDGARPDIEIAAKYGLRYVHVPFGYAGIPRDAQERIVKAVETCEGPIYIHCHHGLHRGPAGAMIARIAVDGVSNQQAIADLKASGCGEGYKGLYRDVLACVPPTAADLAKLGVPVSYVSPGDIAEHMSDVDRLWDRMGKVKESGWKTPASMPDVDPPHEARILWESFRELARLDAAKKHGDEFMSILGRAEQGGVALEEAIAKGDAALAAKQYEALKTACADCHKKWRNN